MRKSILTQVKEALGGKTAIKIGVIASRLGPLYYYGKMQIQGLELGIEYATNGTWQVTDRKIELLIEEDAGEPGMGGQKARALIEDQGVDILQGATSSAVTIVIAKIAQEYKRILMVEPAAADSITGAHFNQYVFRSAANVSQDAAAGGRYAVEHLGKTFGYIAPDYIWGHQSTEAWKRVIETHGGKTLIEVLAPTKTEDFKPYLEEILAQNPEVLVQSWAGAGYRQLFSDMRDMGIFEKMNVTGGLGDREARHALGLDAVGMVGAIKYSPILPTNPVNDWLRAKHKERYGEDPDLFTGGGFAAGIALIEGLNRTEGNPDGDAMVAALAGMNFEGPKGTYTFRPEDHQALQPMYIVKMVPDPDQPWAIPQLIQEMTPEETSPPLMLPAIG